jgi:hypothetical protein
MMKHSLSMINYLSMNYLPIFSRWLWKYVVYIINISLLAQIIGSHFWWYLCSIFSFQPTKYSLSATDRIRNPPTLLRIIRKSLFFFQQCSLSNNSEDNLILFLKKFSLQNLIPSCTFIYFWKIVLPAELLTASSLKRS